LFSRLKFRSCIYNILKEQYQELCKTATKQDNPSAVSEAVLDAQMQNTTSQKIGPYNAWHHESGLFSTIYKAQQPDSGELIALKLTTPANMLEPHDSHREARLLHIAKSLNVVPLLDTFAIPGGHFVLKFPFLPHDLSALLHQGVLKPLEIKSHLHSLASAVAHVHSVGIIHRDIKPSNVLLASPSGPAYLADFGIAWSASDPKSEPADKKITDVGTTCYRAPELLFGNTKYGVALDMWAYGCVVAECFLGGRKTLFNAGDLGSELALISSIFTTLGTPNDDVWPEAKTFDDWGKIQFHEYAPKPWTAILPDVNVSVTDLVSKLVVYESGTRLTASQV
jgi:serine/threonine protein kinase